MTKYATYILESEVNGSYYIGYTSNLEQRLQRHNQGRERYTKKYKPYNLVFVAYFDTSTKAYQYERKLKRIKNKEYLHRIINGIG